MAERSWVRQKVEDIKNWMSTPVVKQTPKSTLDYEYKQTMTPEEDAPPKVPRYSETMKKKKGK